MRITAVSFLLGIENYMLPCFTKRMFGVDCPGCGTQRALVLLAKGEFVEAFYMYPAIYVMVVLFGTLALNQFTTIKFSNTFIRILVYLTVGAIMTNYLLKFL